METLINTQTTVTVMEIISDLQSREQEESNYNDKEQIRNIGGPLRE